MCVCVCVYVCVCVCPSNVSKGSSSGPAHDNISKQEASLLYIFITFITRSKAASCDPRVREGGGE